MEDPKRDEVAEFLSDALGCPVVRDDSIIEFRPYVTTPATIPLSVTISYAGSKTVERLLEVGKYDWEDQDISDQNFPTGDRSGEETIELSLIHFGRVFTSGDEVIRALDEAGFIPAMPAHLLALGAAKPDLQRQFDIAALGQFLTVSEGYRRVVCLVEGLGGRYADLQRVGGDWDKNWRFLAVPK